MGTASPYEPPPSPQSLQQLPSGDDALRVYGVPQAFEMSFDPVPEGMFSPSQSLKGIKGEG